MSEADTENAGRIHNRQRIPMLEMDEVEEQSTGNRTLTTHLMPHFIRNLSQERSIPKVIVVMRNPKDMLVSYYHFYRSIPILGNFTGSFQDFFKVFEAKQLAFGDVFDFVEAWVAHPMTNNFFYVTYEDLKENMESEIRRMCKYLDKRLTDTQIENIMDYSSFDQMKSNPMSQTRSTTPEDDKTISHFLRKGTIGDWKSYMTLKESELVDKMCIERLKPLGLYSKC